MTAEPSRKAATPQWPVPPQDGYTVDDLFRLPGLPPHTEMIDGSLVFVSPQRRFHSIMIDLLVAGLRGAKPAQLRVYREMAVVLDERNAPEPDISVVRTGAVGWLDQTRFDAKDVVLAVEVVSPDSEARDRDTKPHKYAQAGIPHFWLVELAAVDEHPLVHAYTRDPDTGTYVLVKVHSDRLKTSEPFPMDLDISPDALDRL